eukprot:tig00001374_g8508.t1
MGRPYQLTQFRFNTAEGSQLQLRHPVQGTLILESGVLFISTAIYQFFALRTADQRVVKRTLLANVLFLGSYLTVYALYLQGSPERIPQWPVIMLAIVVPAFFCCIALIYLACWACGCSPSRDDYNQSELLIPAGHPSSSERSPKRASRRTSSSARDPAPPMATYKLGYSHLT